MNSIYVRSTKALAPYDVARVSLQVKPRCGSFFKLSDLRQLWCMFGIVTHIYGGIEKATAKRFITSPSKMFLQLQHGCCEMLAMRD